ncbi:MAG TPA: tRNA lysidine(34) synthetase TilS [Thermoanaerobaculia bacterium]|nr:tRNA lysidine(34) synthetase TilS [Thermoanaerobaculia bacterium]
MPFLPILERFFREEAPLRADDRILMAFSGGADSTALLLGLTRLARRLPFQITAIHLDHALDEGSAGRAAAAAEIAGRLRADLVAERRAVPELRHPGESLEAAARRVRYELLEETRRRLGARWVATAHHRDDQAETVLLRMLFGSGLEGLAGIRPVHGAVVRPLLGVPRAALRDAVTSAGLPWVDDPTNSDLAVPRNRVRHALLPSLAAEDDDVAERLIRLARRAGSAGAALDRRLAALLRVPGCEGEEEGGEVAVDRAALLGLPPELLPFALAGLHRRSGAPYPAGRAAREELLRQLSRTDAERIACDCGDGWRWEAAGRYLVLGRAAASEPPVRFTYTLEIPGELAIPELGVRVGLHHRPVEPWMFQGSPHRAGLALPLQPGDRVTVRNRRPGDRLHPLGASGSRRLKEVLIDRRIPRSQRDRLPLLCVGEKTERIAWVPGVTIDQRFRITGEAAAWVAEVQTR